jgi:hypothetical protein
MAFDWIDRQINSPDPEPEYNVRQTYLIKRARRIILDEKITEALDNIQKWTIERMLVCSEEEKLEDKLSRRK